MFRELMPLLEKRSLSITVSALSDGRIRVNVVPQRLDLDGKINEKIGYGNKDKIAPVPQSAIEALTTPLSLTGTAEEIDASLSHALTQFTQSHVQLHNTLELASQEITEAVKAAQEREKNKGKAKAASSTSAESKASRKPGSDELLPLWCVPPSKSTESEGGDKREEPAPGPATLDSPVS
jgi:PRTRC genetic system protein E